jgi:hypothetical protein
MNKSKYKNVYYNYFWGLNMNYVEIWRKLIIGDNKSWVVFENGTCIILMEPKQDLATQAIDIMKEYGPVYIGTGSADVGIIKLDNDPGWVVTGHHPDMLNYISPDDLESDNPEDFVVGLLGRFKRETDSKSLKIIHIEDNR